MMTSAAQLDIDSCPIEGFNRVKIEEILSDEGAIDTSKFGVSAMVTFGYKQADQWNKWYHGYRLSDIMVMKLKNSLSE